MASTKSEAPATGFSYAQAAKGQAASAPSTKPSSVGGSGASTPATNLATDSTSNTNRGEELAVPSVEAADKSQPVESSESNGSISAENTKSQEESSGARLNDNVSDSADTSSNGDKTSKTDSSSRSTQATDAQDGGDDSKEVAETKPAKPVYTEAKPPTVNIWAQRAADQKAKTAAVQPPTSSPTISFPQRGNDSERGKFDPRRKSEQGFKKSELPNKPQNDVARGKFRRDGRPEEFEASRKPQPKPRDRANSEILTPAVSSNVAWPKPTDIHDDERKKHQEEKDKASINGSKAHGKTEWTRMPYTPTAVFETRIEGRGSYRMGKGVGRAGQPTSARGPPPQGSITGDAPRGAGRGSDLVNGGRINGRNSIVKGEREPTSPQTKSASISSSEKGIHAQDEPLQIQPNGTIAPDLPSSTNVEETSAQAVPTGQDSASTRKGKSPKNQEASFMRSGSNNESNASIANDTSAADASTGVNGTTESSKVSKTSVSDRRLDTHPMENGRDSHGAYREGKRGGRKGGNRGGFSNGSFSSPTQFANGFPDFPGPSYPASPSSSFYPTRGNGGNRGYRNQGGRSQSIPLDAFGRQINPYGGYPMVPAIQPYVPDYYGAPYSAGPFPFHPSAERDLLTATVLNQIEYYFSVDNLLKDTFLRKQMDSQGWIFLQVVAQFNRLKQLTTDYEILKSACLQSSHVEIRVGDDGKDRLRKAQGWEQWVLPKEDRDPSARSDGPTDLRRPSPVRNSALEQPPMSPQSAEPMSHGRRSEHSFHLQDAASAPFYPGMVDPRFGDFSQGFEEVRGRQARPSQQRDDLISPLTNGISSAEQDPSAEADRFPTSQIENLTVVVRKHDVKASRPSIHNANSRTFSNGSIDSRSIMDEVIKSQGHSSGNATNGVATHPTQR
ncbi:hypothetical protein ANO11243_041230 [Dothideomycetidae sp. 11243]|nr:hypothetical protein ANO11243_041230 [fungal sp. No.11243]